MGRVFLFLPQAVLEVLSILADPMDHLFPVHPLIPVFQIILADLLLLYLPFVLADPEVLRIHGDPENFNVTDEL